MPASRPVPRVTLGIATLNRDTYLEEAIGSGLSQSYADLEVLVVLDGTTNPRVEEVLAQFAGEPRLRVVRHPRNLGIAAAYNTFVSEGRGELIAMVGDDDVCLPDRIARQVELFDRRPDTGVVHGDAIVIDSAGRQTGAWSSRDFSPGELLRAFFFSHNHLIDPTRMVRREVYERVGGYDERYPLANDLDFWLRACRKFRFRHCPGGPLTAIRRHGANTSDEVFGRAAEIADVEAILDATLDRVPLREIVPELDWPVLHPLDARRSALERIADGLERRGLPLPGLAARVRERAAQVAAAPRPVLRRTARRRLMMTSFGWADAGGGTTVPRLAARELVRRGWEVTVFHAATRPTGTGIPYEVRTWEDGGVRLVGVHNRPHGLWDLMEPRRELDDPPITEAFSQALDTYAPDVVHFHNLHNLGAALIDQAAARGLPAFFTTHNYWLLCPRAYLMDASGAICAGPGDGSRCASCTGSHDPAGNRRRLGEIRSRAERGLTSVLAVSEAVRQALLAVGYDPELVEVVRQAMPHDREIWETTGAHRSPGRISADALRVAFIGSAYPHKGPQLLVEAAQRTRQRVEVSILGEVPAAFAETLRGLDRRGVVRLHGSFSPAELGELLAEVDAAALPSRWWDCAPLAAAECRAARLPLLVPRLGGLPETITDGQDGLLFDGLDPDSLAAALDRLAGDPGLLERMQAAIGPPADFGRYVDALEARYDGRVPHDAGPDRPASPPAVRWQGDFGLATSLSIVNDRVSERLAGPVQQVGRDGGEDRPLPHPAAVEVRHAWPPDLSPARAGALAAIVPWEFGSVPREWVRQIARNVDELWVPSDYVRAMYVADGVDPERVVTLPNGVDLDCFRPAEKTSESDRPALTRFLFVGGLIMRKGPDLLLEAWQRAFPGRDDVVLVVKDFGADGVYAGGDRSVWREYAASGALPRVELIETTLDPDALADLHRSCDVLVHPYRGEGFAMPVLEAMACGLPVIVTAGGPTDEFVPDAAAWRIRSERRALRSLAQEGLETVGEPWLLEPDLDHLTQLLREAANCTPEERQRRGEAARAAAERLSWERVAARYRERIAALAGRVPRLGRPEPEPFPFEEKVSLRVLATPAWLGEDRLPDLLGEWAASTWPAEDACLYLLADPAVAPTEQVEQRVLAAAAQAGADLDACADVTILLQRVDPHRDLRLHRGVDAYVPLHLADAGSARSALRAATAVITLGRGELEALIHARRMASTALSPG